MSLKSIWSFRLGVVLGLLGIALPLYADKLCVVDDLQYYIVEPENGEPVAEVMGLAVEKQGIPLVIPAKITNDGVTYRVSKVRRAAFLDCSFLSVDIADGVSIDENGFYQASARTINIGTTNPPDDAPPSYVGLKAFYKIRSNCTITLGNRVDSIGEEAFAAGRFSEDRYGGTNYIVKVILNPNVRTIGNNAFRCIVDTQPLSSKLKHIGNTAFYRKLTNPGTIYYNYNVAFIPPGVQTIGRDLFHPEDDPQRALPCPEHLRKQFLENNNSSYYHYPVFFYPDDAIIENGDIMSPDRSTMYFCGSIVASNVRDYAVPEHITCIGDSAYSAGKILNLVIGPHVKSVGKAAFQNSTWSNSTIDIQAPLTEIAPYTFYHEWFYANTRSTLTLPSTVTTIGEYAFYGQNFRQIILPESVREVKEGAFFGLRLARVIYHKGYEYDPTRFGRWQYVSQIEQSPELAAYPILFDPDRMILTDEGYLYSTQGDTIYAAPYLTEAPKFPSGLKAFAPYSMAYTGVDTFNIPPTVNYIGEGAFYGATASELNLKVKAHIARKAFANNPNLVKADISRATTVEPDAFAGNTKLNTVVIGYPLPAFSGMAFPNDYIKRVEYHTDTPQATVANLFSETVYANATLYVPVGSRQAMLSTIPWGLFRKIVEDPEISGIDDILVTDDYDTNAPVSVYDLRGICVGHSTDNLPAGIYIVRQGSRTDKLVIP